MDAKFRAKAPKVSLRSAKLAPKDATQSYKKVTKVGLKFSMHFCNFFVTLLASTALATGRRAPTKLLPAHAATVENGILPAQNQTSQNGHRQVDLIHLVSGSA